MTRLTNNEIILFLKSLKIKEHDHLTSNIEDINVTEEFIQIILNTGDKENRDIEAVIKIWRKELIKYSGMRDCRIILTSHSKIGNSPDATPALKKSVGEKYQLENLGKIIAVASGKGGVGKSTISSNLAVSLSNLGYKVGILDADIYGPSQPKMFGIRRSETKIKDKKIQPEKINNVTLISMGMMIPDDQAIVWRGPMLMRAIQQLLVDVDWGYQDFTIIDLPPGTGDIHITLAQKVKLAGAIVVSTPQDIALIDAKKAINLYKKTNTRILGIIENMSYFECINCGERHEIFSGGSMLQSLGVENLELLGEIPLIKEIRECGDQGVPFASKGTDKADIFKKISEKIINMV
mgnify:CR=1 FL=1